MSFRFEGIDHVQLAAPQDCEQKARAFFGELLGWTELEKPAALKDRCGVWFRCGMHEVHIGVQSSFIPALKAHPGFAVRGLEQLKEKLTANGIGVIDDELRIEEGFRRFFAYDPFGNRLEFLERIETEEEGDG
ncbi:VOC family protein [Paenibacillus soyae]|uniref:Glyoxalase n=1 Tax=Paenibacillus soyae TaxID=2969249 RepID=A0A9X2S9E7_9BACL|nr:VOC family protein [Paenibacillus soyae]MCR2802672.1 glyoxalase [Paenibacillus soyae]